MYCVKMCQGGFRSANRRARGNFFWLINARVEGGRVIVFFVCNKQEKDGGLLFNSWGCIVVVCSEEKGGEGEKKSV